MADINNTTPMEDLTIGGNIYEAGNAMNFKTGDWRSMRPVYISDKCKQCGLCFPVCPENAIPVNRAVEIKNVPIFLIILISSLFSKIPFKILRFAQNDTLYKYHFKHFEIFT